MPLVDYNDFVPTKLETVASEKLKKEIEKELVTASATEGKKFKDIIENNKKE